jgi:hypothetical protein
MENLAFNYISAMYLQQQQMAAQMALINQQSDFQAVKEPKKLSFGMDAILGNVTKTENSYESVIRCSPTKPMSFPMMSFSAQKPAFDPRCVSRPMNFVPHMNRLPVSLPKSKRNRTVFTNDQLERLEVVFVRSKYLVGNERSALASELGLNETQVKVWFQNRRIKFRKQTKSAGSQSKSDSCHDSSNASSESESESSIIEIKCSM